MDRGPGTTTENLSCQPFWAGVGESSWPGRLGAANISVVSTYETTERTRLRRHAERGTYDRDVVHAILDEAPIAHVGVVTSAGPMVLPMAFARIDESIYLHGAAANALLRAIADGAPCCITVTLLDGLVLARSEFHHSMNFRCVVIQGVGERVVDAAEKVAMSAALVDHIAPGRSSATRSPTEIELRSTIAVRIPLVEVSAKVRTGPPIDDADDLDRDVWAGVIPVEWTRGTGVRHEPSDPT